MLPTDKSPILYRREGLQRLAESRKKKNRKLAIKLDINHGYLFCRKVTIYSCNINSIFLTKTPLEIICKFIYISR